MGARRRRLGEVLLSDGVISELDLARALEAQSSGIGPRRRLGATLIELGIADEHDLARALSTQLGLDIVDFNKHAPSAEAISKVGSDVARRYQIVPVEVESDGALVVAMVDPTNIVALDELRMMTRSPRVRPVVSAESGLQAMLERYYPINGSGPDVDSLNEALEGFDDEDDGRVDDEDIDAKPIVRLANTLIIDAMRLRASDVHVEPTRGDVRVRFRVDGIMTEVMKVPRAARAPLISRLKLMGGMDISERRRPQDGRMAMSIHGEPVDIRMSSMPSMHGEKVVMRLLRRGAAQLELEELQLAPDVEAWTHETLESPQGILLVTGPTGSGKTTTLYAGLAEIATITRNVITLEDPIEYELDLVNQTQVNPRIGFTFAVGMRTVLRQDPDVIMVGEIRDAETSELAFEAAMTGHLVLSTVHTNDAPSTILRMSELGVPRHLIASSLSLVIAQRLVRLICDDCAEPDEELPDQRTLRRLRLYPDALEGAPLRRGKGCAKCANSGFRGRHAVVEALRVTAPIRDLITAGATESTVRAQAQAEGMRSLRHDGIRKVLAGLTTFEEVLRSTPDDPRLNTNDLVRALVSGDDGLESFLIERRHAPRDPLTGEAVDGRGPEDRHEPWLDDEEASYDEDADSQDADSEDPDSQDTGSQD